MDQVYDPVCGMEVTPTRAAATSRYAGETYYFCARACKEQFDKDPERFHPSGQILAQRARTLYEALNALSKIFYGPAHLSGISKELTDAEWFTLKVLGREGGCRMRDLADECEVALSTMTGVIDRLVSKGLVRRRHSQKDRRVVLVKLTGRGELAYQERLDADMRLVLAMLKALDPTEQTQLVASLQKIVCSLSDVSQKREERNGDQTS